MSGIGFGFALEKGQVFAAQTIVGQFLFKDWTMMKVLSVGNQTLTSWEDVPHGLCY